MAVPVPGLQVRVGFTEGECPFARVPESCCADENASQNGLIKGLQHNPDKGQLSGSREHRIIEAKDFNAWQRGECLEAVVETIEVVFDTSFVSVQQGPRDRRVLFKDVADRFGQARRTLNVLADRYLFPLRGYWSDGPAA